MPSAIRFNTLREKETLVVTFAGLDLSPFPSRSLSLSTPIPVPPPSPVAVTGAELFCWSLLGRGHGWEKCREHFLPGPAESQSQPSANLSLAGVCVWWGGGGVVSLSPGFSCLPTSLVVLLCPTQTDKPLSQKKCPQMKAASHMLRWSTKRRWA